MDNEKMDNGPCSTLRGVEPDPNLHKLFFGTIAAVVKSSIVFTILVPMGGTVWRHLYDYTLRWFAVY